MIRSLAAALGVIDAHKGLIPPNWGHVVPKSKSNEGPAGQHGYTTHYRASPDVYRQEPYRDTSGSRYGNH